MRIYTRTGDAGETGLFDGTRVSKSDGRVDAYGEIDELNSALGVARAAGVGEDVATLLVGIQKELHAIGARLADPSRRIPDRVGKAVLDDEAVRRLEEAIDRFEAELPPLRHFILAGGSLGAANLHLARTVCRRAERRIVALHDADPLVLVYVNRLSDLLFVLARAVNRRHGVAEIEW